MSRRKPGAAADPRSERARRVLADTAQAHSVSGLLDEAGGFTEKAGHSNDDGHVRRLGQEQIPPRIRWRTGVRAGILLAAVSLVLAGWYWFAAAGSRPQVMPLSAVADAAESPGDASDEGEPDASAGQGPGATEPEAPNSNRAEEPGQIVVHVAGAVHRAGVVELAAGSRIHEAISAAGGSTAEADLNQLNLAARMEDGQKLLVPRAGEQLPAADGKALPGAASAEGSPAGGRINLNTASAEELGTLPRVGPVLAQRIVDWRRDHGRFTVVEELDAVDGVGPKMLAALLPLVTV